MLEDHVGVKYSYYQVLRMSEMKEKPGEDMFKSGKAQALL